MPMILFPKGVTSVVDLSQNIYGNQNNPRYLFAVLEQFIACQCFESEYLEIWL